MTPAELQQWLNAHGATLIVDGKPGAMTRAAIMAVFASNCAPAVNDADLTVIASRLGCTVKQLKAVATVESGGSAFDKQGRPKILFERHLFHRLTDGRYTPNSYSQPKGGGYNENSWLKLTLAASRDADAAFAAVSWGKFQVLGSHWNVLGYPSPIELAYSTVTSEAAHFELLARFIEKNGLKPALQNLSANSADDVAFARRYNGPAYAKFDYHNKLARAMA